MERADLTTYQGAPASLATLSGVPDGASHLGVGSWRRTGGARGRNGCHTSGPVARARGDSILVRCLTYRPACRFFLDTALHNAFGWLRIEPRTHRDSAFPCVRLRSVSVGFLGRPLGRGRPLGLLLGRSCHRALSRSALCPTPSRSRRRRAGARGGARGVGGAGAGRGNGLTVRGRTANHVQSLRFPATLSAIAPGIAPSRAFWRTHTYKSTSPRAICLTAPSRDVGAQSGSKVRGFRGARRSPYFSKPLPFFDPPHH